MYLYNNLTNTILFKGGYIEVKAKTSVPVLDSDVKAGIFEHALATKMVDLYNTLAEIPQEMGIPLPTVKIETVTSGLGASSEDELKEFVAKSKAKAPAATTTSIGKEATMTASVPTETLPPEPVTDPSNAPGETLPPQPAGEEDATQSPVPGSNPVKKASKKN